MKDSHRLLLGGAILLAASANAVLSSHHNETFVKVPEDPAMQRRFAVLWIQNYADHIGFGGQFAQVGDRTLVMTGSELCGPDFPHLIPPAAWAAVAESGFETFRCETGGVWTELAVKP